MASSKQGNRHALRHGLYARETVLPWESEQAFVDLHQSFVDELKPEGPLEQEAVREVAELHWRKQRLALGYLLPFYREMPPAALIDAARQGLMALAAYLAKAETPGAITATSSQILDFIKNTFGGPAGSNLARNATTMMPAVASASVIEAAYDPAALELRLKIETSIDNRIAKTMARLVGLKEYKLMYVDIPTVTAPPPLLPNATAPVETVEEPAPVKKRQWGDPD
jgi:hypothetical protein